MPVRSANDTLPVKTRESLGTDEEEPVENWSVCFDGLADKLREVEACLEKIDSRIGGSHR